MMTIHSQGMKKIVVTIAIGLLVIGAFLFRQNATSIIDWVNTLGVLAPIFFLLIYCLATLLFLPTMIFSMAGGVIFGPIWGSLFNVIGASIGAACAFYISRHILFDRLTRQKNTRTMQLIAGVERRGWQFLALLRLIPIIPFNIVNYGLGLTRIKFSHYMMTTILFLIPTEILTTYCGYMGMDMLIQSGELYKRSIFEAVVVLGLIWLGVKLFKHKRLET